MNRFGKMSRKFPMLMISAILLTKRSWSLCGSRWESLSDHENKYIVAFDQAFDNIQVVREHQLL